MKTKIEKKEQKSNLYSKREEKEEWNWENETSTPKKKKKRMELGEWNFLARNLCLCR